jgi:hypothetical protein
MIELLQAYRRRRIALVGEVVGFTSEPVDEGDRPPQPRREQHRGYRKVLVMIDRH